MIRIIGLKKPSKNNMAQVSRRKMQPMVANRMYNLLWEMFVKLKKRQDSFDVISDLFTATEKTMVAKRLAIAIMLEKNYDYEDIKDILCVSAGTIAKVKSILTNTVGLKSFVNKIIKEEKVVEFCDKIEEIFLTIGGLHSAGGSFRKDLYQLKKKKIQKQGEVL